MKTITFELTSPFKYSNNSGTEIECSFIELREPTGKVSHICCEIESLIQSGILKMSESFSDEFIEKAKEDKTASDEEQSPESILSVMNSGGDMKKIVLNFRELFKMVAFMGGEKEITFPRMDDMSHKDFKMMMGVYASNFIMS